MAGEFKIIGLCRGVSTESSEPDAKGDVKTWGMVKIQHDGTTQDWKCWSTTEAKKAEPGKWYEFEVATPPRERGNGVWHNLNKVIGPAQQPQPGNEGGPGAQASHALKTDAQFAKERTGINRHGAINVVMRILELAPALDDPAPKTLDDFMDMVTAEAERLEAWYGRDPGQPASEAPKPKRQAKPTADSPAPASNGHPVQTFAHVGELLTLLKKESNKGPTDLCKLVGVDDVKDIVDLAATYKVAVEAWAVPAEVV